MKRHILLVLAIAVTAIKSCDLEADFYTINIQNTTNSTLKFHVASEDSPVIYPDTILPSNRENIVLQDVSGNVFWGGSKKWEDVISALPSDTLSIYFFHPDTLSTYSWDVIRDEYKILKRYDLSVEDLQSIDLEVFYPTTPMMEAIRQYPPNE